MIRINRGCCMGRLKISVLVLLSQNKLLLSTTIMDSKRATIFYVQLYIQLMSDLNIYGEIFSEVYNLYWTEFIDIIAPQIIKFYNQLNLENNYVLDLACGTGRLSKYLVDAGFNVTGIDLSSDMIRIAKRKMRETDVDTGVEFIVGDITDFNLDKKYGLVVSTFDSLNHLGDMGELANVFANAYDVLINDGVFIFDLNTENGLKKWDFVDFEDNENAVFIMHGVYDQKLKKAYTKVIGFYKHGKNCYKKFDELMSNTVFDLSIVKDTLLDVGWKKVYFVKEDDLMTKINDPEVENRVIIIARK